MYLRDLKVGEFGKINGHIFYRYKLPPSETYDRDLEIYNGNLWRSNIGTWIIEKHNHNPVDWTMYNSCVLIANPERQHINNAIAKLKDGLKNKSPDLDNLTYIENLNALKKYLNPVIVEKEEK